ncbi:MAG: hypothetical protein RMK34_10450, partial [Tepidimonas sp.]|nr:hypothetical protein [Tepidimonas sp.]
LGSVLLASPARHAASRVGTWLDGWAQRRALARAAARTAALTPSATSAAEAHPASPQDWAEALAPLGPALPPTARDMAAGWAWHQAELVTMPNGRRFSLFYI